MKVLLFGGTGLLGRAMMELLTKEGVEVIAHPHGKLDVTDFSAVREAMEAARPDWGINLAAAADVDRCESEPLAAYRVNALGPWNIAAACDLTGSGLVHMSTDYVFDGTKSEPYVECDRTNPIQVYGRSKLEGEHHIAQVTEKHFIVRTAWLFGAKPENFVPWVLDVGKCQSPVYLVDDQWGSPTYVKDLAEGIYWLISAAPLFGTYHMVNRGIATRRQLGELALRYAGIETPVEGMPAGALPRPAARPRFTPLRNWALELRGEWTSRPYQEALEEFVKSHAAG